MIAWAIETLIATTLLMLLVLAIRQPVRRAFGPDVAYALWALPVLRLLLPPLPESWRESTMSALPALPAPEDITIYLGEPVMTLPVEPASGIGWPSWVLIAWAVGAAAFLAYHLITHSRFCARVREMAGSVRVVAAGNVEVIETGAATGPLAFGIRRKYVAFPRDFAERYDPLERDLALAHELGHHARGDLIANWVALVVLGIHWFNPIAWRAFRAFRADQEMACDALVLSGRAPELRHAYGRAIVKSAHGGAVSAACHLHTVNELKGRLRMLTKHEKASRGRLAAGTGALAALTLAGLGLTASGTQAAERVRSGIESTTGVDIASLELPPLPQVAPPAAPAPAPEPQAAPTPPLPPAPPEAAKHKRKLVVTRDKDGKVTTHEFSDDDFDVDLDEDGKGRGFAFRRMDDKDFPWNDKERAEFRRQMKAIPEVSSRSCGNGSGSANQMVIHTKEGEKRKIIICTDRIERQADLARAQATLARNQAELARTQALAQVDVASIERNARAQALAGLRRARASVERADMGDDARAHALKGIDQAIADMESGKD
ncbi:peptidase M56 [Sphingomonas cannabina]|uniref:M56 family metallopeptidase n=1 Tax=Sphingomonas cannabina TaxID=2899123 RepID=UPI001F475A24|nr:M56 family metallopeptidase [Sphingomonas cannabina]UIJ46596.1 peptidase M56 [Sphingomonas cannabina]